MPNIGAYPGDNPPSLGAQDYSAPTNQPPTFTSSPVTGVRATQPYSYSVTTTDPEADTITLTAPVLPSWMSFVDNGDGTGTLSGTPTKANSGDHSVTLRAAHSGDSSTTDQSFTVHVRNFGVVRGMKGAVQIPTRSWREWRNYFVHTSAEITKADYHSAGGSIVDAAVDGPPGFTEYNTISICDDGTTFSNLYNPGSGNITVPPVGNLMMSWYMKREDGGAASVGINSTTGSCYTRIFSGTSPAGQVGEEAVGDGWYRGWCTAYGLTTGSMINTGLLRASTQYANDGNSKLYVTCFQLEPIVPGVVDETTGPSPFRPTTDWADPTIGERKRLRSNTTWTPTDPMTQLGKYAFLQSDSYWIESLITKTRDTTELSPITGIPTYKLVEDVTVNGRHTIATSTDISVSIGIQYKFVGIGKYDGDRTHMLLGTGAAGFPNNSGKFFDLQNGAVSNDFGAFAAPDYGEIESLGNGWYKCIMYFTADAGGTTNFGISNGNGPDANYNGDGTSGILFAGGYVQKAGEPDLLDTMGYRALNVSGSSTTIHSANNVVYRYKGAEQPLKDFGALALGFNMDLVTDLVYDLVQDLVRD